MSAQKLRAVGSPGSSVVEAVASDDDGLMQQVACGDSDALAVLYERYSRPAYSLALRMLGNSSVAEDILQEAFWRVWRRSATYQAGQGQFAPWFFGIVRNLCIDELRRQRSRPDPVYETEENGVLRDLADDSNDVYEATWQGEQRRAILAALQQLPADQRQAVELAYFGGLSQREIAERLNNPLGTIKTRIRLAMQKLQDLLHLKGYDLE